MNILNKIKQEKTNLPESIYFQLDNIEADIEKTLGDLTFMSCLREEKKNDEVVGYRYNLISLAQETDFNVVIENVEERKFEVGTPVKLIEPRFSTYAINRKVEGIRVVAKDIVAAGPLKETKPVQEDKK